VRRPSARFGGYWERRVALAKAREARQRRVRARLEGAQAKQIVTALGSSACAVISFDLYVRVATRKQWCSLGVPMQYVSGMGHPHRCRQLHSLLSLLEFRHIVLRFGLAQDFISLFGTVW
jgi:hypothetical protein